MKKFLFFVLVAVLSACTIAQRFSFNNDFSGNLNHVVDYTRSIENSLGEIQSKTESKDAVLDSTAMVNMKSAISAIRGISNILIKELDNKVEIDCQFADINALNTLLSDDNKLENNVDQFCSFRQKGKKMFVTFNTDKLKKNNNNESPLGDNEDLFKAITYRFEYHFEQGVKSAKGTPSIISEDKKTVVIEQNLQQLSDSKFKKKLKIKLSKGS
jgi:lipopolysaccharide export LptBFGC system permease protein LptF